MNDHKDDKLFNYLRENAPQAPAAPEDLAARIEGRIRGTPHIPFAAAFATAAVLALGMIVSISGKQNSSEQVDEEAISAQDVLIEAALGFEAAEETETSDEISEDLYGEWLSLAATVAQN